MAAQQTSYSLTQALVAQAGFVSNTDTRRVAAFRNDNASPIAFGLAVSRSSNIDDRGFDALIVSRQFLGVLTYPQSKENGVDGLPTKEMGDVLSQGEVLVRTVETVTPDSPVRVYIVDNTGTLAGTVIGAFGTAAVTAKTALLANAKYVSRGTAGTLVKVQLNGPGPILLTAD